MKTLLPLEQVRLVSTHSGSHILDTYIEESEKGGRTLPDLLDDLFLPDGTLAVNLEMRYNGPNIEYRYGVFTDPEEGWTAFLKFHQWEGEYLSGYDYLAGDVVSYGNGIIYFVEDYPNAPATPNPTTDPKMVWIIDDAFINAVLSEISLLKSDTQTIKDDTQTLHDSAEQILLDVTSIESNIEAIELNVAGMETNVTAIESVVEQHKLDTEAAASAADIAKTSAQTAEANAYASELAASDHVNDAQGHSNQAEIHKDTAETAAQTAINATDSKYDKTGGDITGDVNISGSLTIGGDEVWDAGNFNPANYMPLAGGNFTAVPTVQGNEVWHGGNVASKSPDTATALLATDLNTLTTPGLYYQPHNANTTGNNYPVNEAGSLLIQKSAGQCTQFYITYNTGAIFTRTYYNSWSAWKEYVAYDADGNIQVGEYRGIETTGAWTRTRTAYGTIDFGPANNSYAHMYTDSPSFYLNKPMYVDSGGLVFNSKNVSFSKANNGYMKLPNGFIIQWGRNTSGRNGWSGQYSFPITFPTGAFVILATSYSGHFGATSSADVGARVDSTSKYRIFSNDLNYSCFWIAIGR